MSRQQKRTLALWFLFAFSAFLIISHYQGYVIIKGGQEIPMTIPGYIIGFGATLGAFGVNIWKGGALDPANDPR